MPKQVLVCSKFNPNLHIILRQRVNLQNSNPSRAARRKFMFQLDIWLGLKAQTAEAFLLL